MAVAPKFQKKSFSVFELVKKVMASSPRQKLFVALCGLIIREASG